MKCNSIFKVVCFLILTPIHANRVVRLGPSVQYLFQKQPKVPQLGEGLYTMYGFILKKHLVLGINLSLRNYGLIAPAGRSINQIGYGLIIKHYLGDGSIRPYVAYGLLQQLNFLSHRKGYSSAHDTRLTIGLDFPLADWTFFYEISYHYTRIRYFEVAPIVLDNIESIIGIDIYWRAD